MTLTIVNELRHERPDWRAWIVRMDSGRLVRVARAPNGAWVASRPSGSGLRVWHDTPDLAIRLYLEDA